jgi:hypothetical protein
MNQKYFRRIAGFVASWFPRLELDGVPDPRHARGKRWQVRQVLAAGLLGHMAGCRGLGEVERLTGKLSRAIRRQFGLHRRLPDTTMRDVLCRLPWQQLVVLLERGVAAARRGKMLGPVGLPFSMVAMDGKGTALPSWDGPYAQKHQPADGLPFGVMRTVTSTLVTAPGRPCIGVSPIPASTNEMGHFTTALAQLCSGPAGSLIKLVSYDQGANSEDNAKAVLAWGKHYLFRLNDERRHMQQLAMDLLETQAAIAETVDVTSNRTEEMRRLQLFRLPPSGLPIAYANEIWDHTRTLVSVEWERHEDGVVVERTRRYYASSLEAEELSPLQWLWAARAHWGVETTHQILDTAFSEDDRPWIRNDPNGMLVVAILRRIACTLLTLYRSVTQRSEEKRQVPWTVLLEGVRDMLVASTEATVASLRKRKALGTSVVATT